MATTVWIPSAIPTGGAVGEGGTSFRDTATTLQAGSLGQVRVKFVYEAGSGIGSNIIMDHCSIGVAATIPNTVATPVELTFNGGTSGFNLVSGTSITSDWVNLNFLVSDTLIFVLDSNASNPGTNFGIITNGNDWKKAASASYNLASVSGFGQTATVSRMVELIETQASAASNVSIGVSWTT